MVDIQKQTEYLVGINLNTMTSTALTAYSKKLTQDISALQAEESSGSMSKARKNLLKQKLQAQRAVTHQSKRLMSFFNELKKAGFDFGSVKEFSVESLAESAMKSSQNASSEQKGLITGIVEKYKNQQTTVLGMDTGVSSLLVGGAKVTGIALMGGAATALAFTTAQAIGKIPIHDSTLYTVVNDWLKKFFPGLKGMAVFAAIGGAMFIAAKKFQQHMNNKDMTVTEAMAEQIADEDERVKNHMKETANVTLATQVSRAESDPSYLQTLVNMVNGSGKSVNQIIVDGPVKCGAELYNAARIIKKVEENAKQQAKGAQEELDQEAAKKAYESAQRGEKKAQGVFDAAATNSANADEKFKAAQAKFEEILKSTFGEDTEAINKAKEAFAIFGGNTDAINRAKTIFEGRANESSNIERLMASIKDYVTLDAAFDIDNNDLVNNLITQINNIPTRLTSEQEQLQKALKNYMDNAEEVNKYKSYVDHKDEIDKYESYVAAKDEKDNAEKENTDAQRAKEDAEKKLKEAKDKVTTAAERYKAFGAGKAM